LPFVVCLRSSSRVITLAMVREEMGRDSEMVLGGRLAVQWEGNQLSHLFQSPRSGFNIRPASCELGSHKPNPITPSGTDGIFSLQCCSR
jgi:hypothetical protein